MPRARRILFEGAFYHVFNRGVEKRVIFLDDRDRKVFLRSLGQTVSQMRLRLFAYCLMENHFHLFLQTPEGNLDEAMRHMQGSYARYFNNRYDRVGSLFQDRYRSRLVEEDTYSLSLCRYIHKNPLEAALVNRLEDYPWSSYPNYLGNLPEWKWLETQWILNQFHPDKAVARILFRQYHAMDPLQGELRSIKRRSPLLGKPNLPKPSLT